MNCSKRIGSIHCIGPHHPIDMSSPPAIGDLVDLTKLDYEFHVEIADIAGDSFTGFVCLVGQSLTIEDVCIKRGDTVSFKEINIKALHRQGSNA